MLAYIPAPWIRHGYVLLNMVRPFGELLIDYLPCADRLPKAAIAGFDWPGPAGWCRRERCPAVNDQDPSAPATKSEWGPGTLAKY